MSRPTTEPFPHVPGFEIEGEIGRGTSARVFRARQEKLNRTVALKIIPTLGDEGNRRALRLFREASLTGALDHPAIVRAIDAGDRDDFCWFAMELVEGRTLQQALDEGGPWSWRQAIALALEILDALDHAHRRGVVHRDLKPSNILIDLEGHARLLDLGLARRETDPRLTHEGGTVGTPKYMAPEQALDPGKVDGRADLFALGAVLYRMISGIAPFEGETVAAVLTRLLYDEPAPLSMLQPDLPEAVSLVIGKVLEKDPAHRFRDAREFAAALREAARGRVPKSAAGSRRGTWALGVVAFAAILAAVLFLVLRPKREAVDPVPKPPAPAVPRPARVHDFVPPAHPELGPLERARLALAANDRESPQASSEDLAAALLPLEQDLRTAAAQHRAAVRGVLLGSGVDLARQKLAQLPDRLRADVQSDGEETIHPGLEMLVKKVAVAATSTFESDLKKEQDDAVIDLERALEAIPSRPGVLRWSLAEQHQEVDHVLKDGGFLSLDKAERDKVVAKRDEVLRRLAAIPVQAANASMKLAREQIAEGKLKTARKLLAEASAAASDGGVPGASVEMKPLLDAIEAEELRLAAEADALVERVARGSAASLDAAGRRKRAADLRADLDRLRASVDEAPQIADAVAFAGKVLEIATPAANLRTRVLEVLGAGPPANTSADWKLIGKGSLGVRTLVGREGAKIAVRRQDGKAETWDAEEVSAQTIADCARVLGEPPLPLSVALLEFWDGEDDAAQARLKGMPGEPVRDWMLGLVGASIETAASSYPTDAEREAFPLFLQARRRHADGAHARALELVAPLLAQKRLAGTAFLRQYRDEMERIAAHSKAMLARSGRLRTFGAAAEIKDERAGRVRLAWTFGEGKPVDGLALPPGGEQVEAGFKWPGVAGDRAGLPELAPALRIEFAEGVPAAPAVVEVEVLRSSEPVAFIALSFGGYSLLALGDLRQSRAFAGIPLHGLERDLVQVQSVQKAILIAGSLADARRLVGSSGRPAALNRTDSTTVRFWIDLERAEISGMVGSEKIPVFGERRNPSEPPALDLRLPPGVVVRSLSIELPLVPRRSE